MKTVGGRRPGLIVMGGDSCSEGRGFESQHCIPDGHFPHFLLLKNKKEAWMKNK